MTRKSRERLERDRRKFPPQENVASILINRDDKKILFVTKDLLVNQIHRDGPRVARSFDRFTKNDIAACSALLAEVQGLLLSHLPRLGDNDFKATAARLLSSASNSFIASVEVARHGYPHQYGVLARVIVETIATILVLATKDDALEQFHAGELPSTKCVSWAKAVLPPIGKYWGDLSNEFVHIGRRHSEFQPPRVWTEGDEALSFVVMSLRANVWLLHVTSDFTFSDEVEFPRYWKRNGREAWFDPSPEVREWMASFLGPTE